MKHNLLAPLSVMVIFSIALPLVAATPIEWHNMPTSGKNTGSIFQLRFEIKSDETINYTITIYPGDEFEVIDGIESKTIQIPIDATRTFIFDMIITNDIEDGKHPIPYTAFKNETQFKTGNIYVRAGTQTPGFELVFLLSAIIIFMYIRKRTFKHGS